MYSLSGSSTGSLGKSSRNVGSSTFIGFRPVIASTRLCPNESLTEIDLKDLMPSVTYAGILPFAVELPTLGAYEISLFHVSPLPNFIAASLFGSLKFQTSSLPTTITSIPNLFTSSADRQSLVRFINFFRAL